MPEGLRSEMKGVSAEMRRKSSSRKSTPAERAIAMRWIVALVEPPVTCSGSGVGSGSGFGLGFGLGIVGRAARDHDEAHGVLEGLG